MSRMFPFITKRGKRWCTWNPLRGKCPYGCVYCWSQSSKGLVQKYNLEKYQCDTFNLDDKAMKQTFTPGEFWFVQDMSDLFADGVPTRLILQVLDRIRLFPETKFLLLTKNPERYLLFIKEKEIPDNCVLGATVESDKYWYWDLPNQKFKHYRQISYASDGYIRLNDMLDVYEQTRLRFFVSIEPVLDFYNDLSENFARRLKALNPWAVAVGYDNYNNCLPEPCLEDTLKLIVDLEKFTTVYKKSLRKAWWESK